MNRKRNHRLCLIALFLFLAVPAFAGDPGGWWTSSTGSKVHLWANMQQVIVTVQSTQGQETKYQGQWTRFSDYFTYSAQGNVYSAAFTNSNQITVTNQATGVVTLWTRRVSAAQPQPQPQPQPNNPPSSDGGSVWSSSTGSSIQLSSQGNQVFVAIIGKDGKRYQGSGRWIQYPKTFDYSVPGIVGVANCTVLNDGRIQVVYKNGTPSYWTKQY